MRNVIQSQEGALNVVPRPRFKINDGADQVESIISHFSQSEINVETEGKEAGPGTVTVLNHAKSTRLQHQITAPQGVVTIGGANINSTRNAQHSSELKNRAKHSLTQQM